MRCLTGTSNLALRGSTAYKKLLACKCLGLEWDSILVVRGRSVTVVATNGFLCVLGPQRAASREAVFSAENSRIWHGADLFILVGGERSSQFTCYKLVLLDIQQNEARSSSSFKWGFRVTPFLYSAESSAAPTHARAQAQALKIESWPNTMSGSVHSTCRGLAGPRQRC
jgi:hypothetical protein